MEPIRHAHTLTVPAIELSFPPIHVIRLDISEKKVPYIILYTSISPFNKLQETCGHGVIIYDIYIHLCLFSLKNKNQHFSQSVDTGGCVVINVL